METQSCCPRFDPAPWDGITLDWKDKRFVKDRVVTFFHIPLNFGGVVKRMMAKIEQAGAKAQDSMGLSDHTSKWNMDLYVPVDKEVPGLENTTLSGQFFCKVYEGPYKDTRKWCEDFKARVTAMNQNIDKWFMWYTTCPKCAKQYGKNYVVLIANISQTTRAREDNPNPAARASH